MLTFDYDPHTDTMDIEGIRYAGQFFRDFARDIPLNTPVRITKRDNGTVTVERIKD